jgi:hypothetical protein
LATSWWHLSLDDIVVGGGTLALAWFTWRLARRTRESVAAATAGVEVEQKSVTALEATTTAAQRPVLVPFQANEERMFPVGTVPLHGGPHVIDDMRAFVAVRNIGAGPALDVRGHLEAPRGGGKVASPLVGIAVGEVACLTFERDRGSLTYTGNDLDTPVSVAVEYDDVSGNMYRTDAQYHVGQHSWRATVGPERVGVKAVAP